jgi:6-phosphogluconate dehydrogenase
MMFLRSSEARVQDFAVIGLGKMGSNLALQALGHGYRVAGFTLGQIPESLASAGLMGVKDLPALIALLSKPRTIFLYIPAGPAIDETLAQLTPLCEPGDIIVDGGNSYWGDSIRRHARLARLGLNFIDLGTSGGPGGARDGACFMFGGDRTAVDHISPLLTALAVEGGVLHTGAPGSGHFVKLVHNGIEFGMLQAIGEGVALLEAYRDKLAVADVLECWKHGSVVRSWLVELMEKSYRAEGGLAHIPDYVEDTGEVNWLVDDALHMEVPAPVISQAVIQLVASRQTANTSARAVAMMRHGFGGHPYGPDKGIAAERHGGRVSGFLPAPKV